MLTRKEIKNGFRLSFDLLQNIYTTTAFFPLSLLKAALKLTPHIAGKKNRERVKNDYAKYFYYN